MPFQLAGILWLLFFAQAPAQSPASKNYSPPGKLIDVGGRKLHLYCTGAGSPTVILMAGGGAFSIDWALVQPKVAQSTRVCSYDRAGLAWSAPGPADETVEQMLGWLRAEAARASRRNRSSACASCAKSSGKNFKATKRPSSVSSAL